MAIVFFMKLMRNVFEEISIAHSLLSDFYLEDFEEDIEEDLCDFD